MDIQELHRQIMVLCHWSAARAWHGVAQVSSQQKKQMMICLGETKNKHENVCSSQVS